MNKWGLLLAVGVLSTAFLPGQTWAGDSGGVFFAKSCASNLDRINNGDSSMTSGDLTSALLCNSYLSGLLFAETNHIPFDEPGKAYCLPRANMTTKDLSRVVVAYALANPEVAKRCESVGEIVALALANAYPCSPKS